MSQDEEWARHTTDITNLYCRTAIEFLTKTGQTCSDIRQEFILLSDVFGLSALVDILNHPKPEVRSPTSCSPC